MVGKTYFSCVWVEKGIFYKVSRSKQILRPSQTGSELDKLSCTAFKGQRKPEVAAALTPGAPCSSKAKPESLGKNPPTVYFGKLTRNKVAKVQKEALEI